MGYGGSWGIWLAAAAFIAALGQFFDKYHIDAVSKSSAREWLKRAFGRLDAAPTPDWRNVWTGIVVVGVVYVALFLVLYTEVIIQPIETRATGLLGGALHVLMSLLSVMAALLPVLLIMIAAPKLIIAIIRELVRTIRKVLAKAFHVASDPQNSPFGYAAGLLSIMVAFVKLCLEILAILKSLAGLAAGPNPA